MNIYVVRHGQTDWNVEHRMQGHTNVPLNLLGINQAKNVAIDLKDIPFDIIISSPLSRALDTANFINEYKNVPILTDERIIERCFGDLEAKTKEAFNDFGCTINDLLNYSLNYNKFKIEPIQDLFARVKDFINDIKVKYNDKNILIATHNGVAQVLDIILNNLPKTTNLLDVSFRNCEFRRYEIND